MKTAEQMIEHLENSRRFFNDTVDYAQQRDFNMRCKNILKYHKIDDAVYLYFINKFIVENDSKENSRILFTAFDKLISNEKLEELLQKQRMTQAVT